MASLQRVLVHNIGHHDVLLVRRGEGGRGVTHLRPKEELLQPAGRALAAVAAGGGLTITPDGRGATLSPPVRVRNEDWPEVRVPLLAAALDAVMEAGDAPLQILLVSAGPASAQSTPVGTGDFLAAWATARLAGRASVQAASVHLGCDAFTLDPAELHEVVQLPILQHAAALAKANPAGWAAQLEVWLSASTGTAAMVSGLAATLSRWKPRIIAVPAARADVEVRGDGITLSCDTFRAHTSRALEAAAQVPLRKPDEAASRAIEELRAWHDHFRSLRPERPVSGDTEANFWFRKGRQEVLATVVVRKPGGGLETLRGVNVEVSLPTGTLCAERNAIGSALVQNPGLRRADILAVAVVGLQEGVRYLGPCGACQEWLRKVAEVNPGLQVIGFEGPALQQPALLPLGA